MLRSYLEKNSGIIVFVYSCILILLFIMPTSNLPKVDKDLPVDKIVHLFLFAVYFGTWYQFFRFNERRISKSIVCSIGFALLTEALQFFVPYRSADGFDILADTIGILIGLLICFILSNFKRKSKIPTK